MEVDQENVLCDVTNAGKSKSKKRLKDGSFKVYSNSRKSRKVMDLTFDNDAKKMLFDAKFEQLKSEMKVKTNIECLNMLIECYESKKRESSNTTVQEKDTETSGDELFICTKSQLIQLIEQASACGPFELVSFSRCGHVAQTALQGNFKGNVVLWNSSQRVNNEFLLNYKSMHSYLCSGMLPCQYLKFSEFLDIGFNKKGFLTGAIEVYSQIVNEEKQKSINDAIVEERSRNTDGDDSGIGIMTDARHACRKNSYHSDVLALGIETHKIVAHVHVTKEEERSSQKHELHGTKRLYEELERHDVKVTEHAHDRNMSISKFLSEQHPEIRDSYDSWHSAKEVRKGISKITKGPRRSIGNAWHPELSDKLAGIKTHIYRSMKNCAGDQNKIITALDNISEHYQNRHGSCHQTSGCQQPGYIPSRAVLTSPEAVRLLQNAVRQLLIYKHPEKYVTCRDTHYVESCNNTFLIYVDKRIHFKRPMYKLRTALAVLDWNEHVDRPATSLTRHVRVQNPRRMAPQIILTPKPFKFVEFLRDRFQLRLNYGPTVQYCNASDSDDNDVEEGSDSDSDNDL